MKIYLAVSPANVAAALARLGLATAFVGVVGNDSPGQQLAHLLARSGVNCAGLQHRPEPTCIVEVQCSPQGDRTFGRFIGGETTEFADAHLIASNLPTSLPNRFGTQLATLQPGAIAAQPHPYELLDFLRAQTGRVWTLGTV
ncbi:MAG: PfkB family carbohydrate kinase [Cyanobacteria bacterium J06607_6]